VGNRSGFVHRVRCLEMLVPFSKFLHKVVIVLALGMQVELHKQQKLELQTIQLGKRNAPNLGPILVGGKLVINKLGCDQYCRQHQTMDVEDGGPVRGVETLQGVQVGRCQDKTAGACTTKTLDALYELAK